MKNLALALYTEGVTDQRFLPDVIRRTSRKLLIAMLTILHPRKR